MTMTTTKTKRKILSLLNLPDRTSKTSREAGNEAEQYALRYLEKKGLQLMERNFHCRFGELDLVMRDHEVIVFIEVRYRKGLMYGASAETVTSVKQRKLVKTAQYFLTRHPKYHNFACRFDVIAASPTTSMTTSLEIDWIKNAFDLQ